MQIIKIKKSQYKYVKSIIFWIHKSILSFKESNDSLLLKFTSLEHEYDYFYLGKVNNIVFKQGRGYLIYPIKKRRYINNFENNIKNGEGVIFHLNFRND